jgi:hypothetical protein
MSTDHSAEVQQKGHEIVEGDERHPADKKQKRSGLGKNYGQVEQDQAKSQTGTGDHVKRAAAKDDLKDTHLNRDTSCRSR